MVGPEYGRRLSAPIQADSTTARQHYGTTALSLLQQFQLLPGIGMRGIQDEDLTEKLSGLLDSILLLEEET